MNKSNAELNATPLIDVFLVLLVMLIVTIPIATHSIRLDLPVGQPVSQPTVQTINIDVESDGRVFWNGEWVASERELSRRFGEASRAEPAPIVKVWPETRARYERVAQVLAAAQRAHVSRLALSPVAE
jgi:biopolymer transport protein ExbD